MAARLPTDSNSRGKRLLVAARRTSNNDEGKEAITMTRKTPAKGEPAKQVAIDLLRTAGEPLHAKEIAKRVIESGRARLKGKTPAATITAMLAVGSKPGGPFKRVDKGTYALADDAPGPHNEGRTQQRGQRRPQKRQTTKPAA